MVEFAKYSLPVFYEKYGAIAEHLWTRASASLFDVSHMCQLEVQDDDETVASTLETITPSVFKDLSVGKAKYTLLLNESGGIIDDLIVTKLATGLYHLVVNASCANKDLAYLQKHFGSKIRQLNKSLIALQGPKALEVLAHNIPDFEHGLRFTATIHTWGRADLLINRTGYTGEDGVEISIDSQHAPELWDALLSNPDVRPSGLAARNSLRLEAGYPLYGSDINEDTSPIEANLSWLVKNLSCYGGKKIAHQMLHGPEKKRVGFKLDSKRIPRNHNEIVNSCNETIGYVTSAAFLPGKNFVAGQALINKQYSIGEPIGIKMPGLILSGNICKLSFL